MTQPDVVSVDVVRMSQFTANGSTETTPQPIISTTFWIVFMVQALLPLVLIAPAILCRTSLKELLCFNKRHVNYDTQLLRRPEARAPAARITNLIFYRHRPLPLELLRMSIEIAILLHILGYVRLVVLLSLWCIFDLVQGLHVLSLVYLKHTPAARSATSLATYIATMYSLLYGFPLGFISKLMWIVWLGSRIAFRTIFVPFYIEAVAALVFAIFFMLPNILWRAGENGYRTIVTRFQVLMLLLSFFGMWLLIYFNVTVCGAPPIGDNYTGTDFKSLFYCASYFKSWTTAFLPIFILLLISLFVVLWATAYKGLVYRFLPEITFLWSGSLVFTAAIHSEDSSRGAILGGTGAVLLVSILITIAVNYILISDILSSLKAPVITQGARTSSVDEVEVKRRLEVRQTALKDYIHEGGRTMLRGTLLRHLKKRDRTKECVVCLESFKKSREITEADKQINEEEGTATDDLLGIIRKCGHSFHFNCVWSWVEHHSTCPLCRTEIEVKKDAIKTVHYDAVRYAIERNRDSVSTIGTVSELVSKESSSRSRSAVSGSLFNAAGIAEEISEQLDQVEEGTEEQHVQQRSSQPKRDTAIPAGAYVVGDGAARYKTPSRSSSKYCGICKAKFVSDRQSKDIVVGYLRNCGHYFHCECIDSYIRDQEKCPTCHMLDTRHTRRGAEGRIHQEASSSANDAHSTEQLECPRHSNEDRQRHGHSHRENVGNPPGRGSRRHREESKRGQQRPSYRSRSRGSSNTDIVPSRSTRESGSSASQNGPDIVQLDAQAAAVAGPSRSRNGYLRNPKAANLPASKRFVHSEDILFAFLSDVQNDIKSRGRGRKGQSHDTSHVV